MPSDTFTHTTTAPVGPGRVYRALQRPETWKGIGPIDDVWDATHDENGLLTGFSWSARAAGRTWRGTALRTAHTPDRSMILDLDSPEVAGAINVEVVPQAPGSEITVILYARSKGLLAGMFWGAVSRALEAGLSRQVEDFAGSL